jgi:hypothetical protein
VYSGLLIISVLVEINKELFRLAGVLEFINQSILKEMGGWMNGRIGGLCMYLEIVCEIQQSTITTYFDRVKLLPVHLIQTKSAQT